jgi:hypothetical protein
MRNLHSSHGLTVSSPARGCVVRSLTVLLFQIRIEKRKGGHYRVRIDNEWIDVPDDAVITEPNRVGMTMAWPIKGTLGISNRCFMPGSMT